MSPPPCKLRQGELLPPPGMKNGPAPAVTPEGQEVLLPVAVSMQWPAFALSPRGGALDGGSVFGRLAPAGMPSPSGGAGCCPAAQGLTGTVELLPVLAQYVRPLQVPSCPT